jgi:hypothetical protein
VAPQNNRIDAMSDISHKEQNATVHTEIKRNYSNKEVDISIKKKKKKKKRQ